VRRACAGKLTVSVHEVVTNPFAKGISVLSRDKRHEIRVILFFPREELAALKK